MRASCSKVRRRRDGIRYADGDGMETAGVSTFLLLHSRWSCARPPDREKSRGASIGKVSRRAGGTSHQAHQE